MLDLKNRSNFNKYIAAGSPYTPEIVLVFLASDNEPIIRRRVAENEVTPVYVLTKLVCDDDTDVRIALIDNATLPVDLLELLARDPNPDVRYALAETPSIPERLLLNLLRDENPYVSQRANRTYHNLHPMEVQLFPQPPIIGSRPPGRMANG